MQSQGWNFGNAFPLPHSAINAAKDRILRDIEKRQYLYRLFFHMDGLDEDGLDEDGLDEDGLDEDGLDKDGLGEDGLGRKFSSH